jgi:hypothetical protein
MKKFFCCFRPGKQEEETQNEASAGAEDQITFEKEKSGMEFDVFTYRRVGNEGGVTLDQKVTVVSQVPNLDRILPQPSRPPFHVTNDSERQSQQARTSESDSESAIYLSNRPTTLRQIPSETESRVTQISVSSGITFVHPTNLLNPVEKMERQEDGVRDRERF